MPGSWSSWKRALSCRTDRDQVIEPHAHPPPRLTTPSVKNPAALGGKKPHHQQQQLGSSRSCSKSLLNLRDVIHGNTRVVHKQTSPRSETPSGECFRQVYSESSFCDTRSSSGDTPSEFSSAFGRCNSRSNSLTSTPLSHASYVFRGTPLRKLSGCYDCNMAYETLDSMQLVYREGSLHGSYCGSPKAGCPKCGETFSKAEALEAHHVSQHAVTELSKGDSSRNVVEIIFRTSWLKREQQCGKIERILKVHNTQRMVAKFEEYRDAVKFRASRLHKKHPRCMADGNELLRFFGSYLQCQLGANRTSNLCLMPNCHCCQLIRSGFHAPRGRGGIYTTATSGKAHDALGLADDEPKAARRAMLVCRVIAGRTYKASDAEDLSFLPSGFDSIAGESGPYANIDELLVFSSRAVLPCFVVVYRV